MVHAMSGETESTILSDMPYARGLQYQNQWFRMVQKIELHERTETQQQSYIL